MDFETSHHVCESEVDSPERLAVASQCLDQDGFRIENSSWHKANHTLEHFTPGCQLAPTVWGAQEYNPIRRDVDRTLVLFIGVMEAVRVDERLLSDNPAQTVRHPQDGIRQSTTGLAKGGQKRDQCLSLVVDKLGAGVFANDIGIVAVDDDVRSCSSLFKGVWKEVCRPVDSVLGRPCLLRLSIQAMDENDVNCRFRVGIDCSDLETCDIFLVDDSALQLLYRMLVTTQALLHTRPDEAKL